MIFVVLFALSFVLLIFVSLFPFQQRYKFILVLFFSITFFLSAIGCIVLNTMECANGNLAACEAMKNTMIN